MNGTLALWYERKSTEGGIADTASSVSNAPQVRLHVNLWRDIDKKFNFLDIGFLLEKTCDLDRLYLYLPAPIKQDSISDLSGALKDSDTLNAVFNEVASLKRDDDDHFVVQAGKLSRVIHHVDTVSDISIQPVSLPGRDEGGTIIALKSALCARITDTKYTGSQHYVRLRIFLDGKAQNLFTTEDSATSVGLSLTQDILETTEFRLNERRSFPHVILQRSEAGQVCLVSVHYFLIRSKNHQLGSQHQNFRKVRHLEPDIWNSYLRVGRPSPSRMKLLGQKRDADGMIIYQWREIAPIKDGEQTSLDGFIAYASFRIAHDRILSYMVAILAIGGVGSALLNVGIAILHRIFPAIGWNEPGSGKASLIVGIGLGICALSPMLFVKLTRRRSK